jgi:hypothetical protein
MIKRKIQLFNKYMLNKNPVVLYISFVHTLDTFKSNYVFFFSSPCQRHYGLLPSLGVRRPSSVVRRLSSVNFSHFNLLL